MLIISETPERVDFPDPVIPRGASAEWLRAALEEELRKLREHGYEADLALTSAEAKAAVEVTAALKLKPYDCIVVGGGLRADPHMTLTFEAVMNVLREQAPDARLAFNTCLSDSGKAVERQLARQSGNRSEA